ncbi:DnaD domain protein [Ruminococcaceae bacterium OttesenSCG-928-D13]|nr:DnaD domain protein [Ruminococcaceae bacterium OttesenSCG-928-D13]
MYRPVKLSGDTVAVPQLLFSRLETGGEDGRFRVALYLLGGGEGDPMRIARALRMQRPAVEAALSYWEGAGLIEQEPADPAAVAEAAPVEPPRRRMTTRESVRAGQDDPSLGVLLGELQRIYGGVVGEGDINIYATLYVKDGFPIDLILMAAAHAASKNITQARYVEKTLANWRKQGIDNCADADALLKRMARMDELAARLATAWNLPQDPFTLAEKQKIVQWYDEYGYGDEMIEAARLAAGERAGDVKYMAGILKKWHAKGYRSPRELQQAEGGANLRVAGNVKKPGKDLLADMTDYIPAKRRGSL